MCGSLLRLSLFLQIWAVTEGFLSTCRIRSGFCNGPHLRNSRSLLFSSANEDQAAEAVQALSSFHNGSWKGTASSFTVTADVAAGIVKRKVSPNYLVSINLGLNIKEKDFSLTETYSWEESVSSRTLSLTDSNVDVDSVDASYSLDVALPDLPSSIIGTDKLLQFGIEHCIAVSEDERARCLVFYGVDQSLVRIVICNEKRIKDEIVTESSISDGSLTDSASLSASDLLEIQSDVDRLVDKITGQIQGKNDDDYPSKMSQSEKVIGAGSESVQNRIERIQDAVSEQTDDAALSLTPHRMSLVEISSGLWLGDAIIRDLPDVQATSSTGFGAAKSRPVKKKSKRFATWSVGVQKVARRWMWNFGEEIRQVNDVGKAMGAEMQRALTQTLSGSVCVDESLSRRIEPSKRMVYIDWAGDTVGIITGSASIQVPRFLTFGQTRETKPFFTEMCVYQASQNADLKEVKNKEESDGAEALPEVCCSTISRVYNKEGQLRQGCTGFFTLKRFGAGMEE